MLSRRKRTTVGRRGAITEWHKDEKSVWNGCINSEFMVFLRKGGDA
jgi:hypothetical protein